jgi:CheY-like chemotaxis protein
MRSSNTFSYISEKENNLYNPPEQNISFKKKCKSGQKSSHSRISRISVSNSYLYSPKRGPKIPIETNILEQISFGHITDNNTTLKFDGPISKNEIYKFGVIKSIFLNSQSEFDDETENDMVIEKQIKLSPQRIDKSIYTNFVREFGKSDDIRMLIKNMRLVHTEPSSPCNRSAFNNYINKNNNNNDFNTNGVEIKTSSKDLYNKLSTLHSRANSFKKLQFAKDIKKYQEEGIEKNKKKSHFFPLKKSPSIIKNNKKIHSPPKITTAYLDILVIDDDTTYLEKLINIIRSVEKDSSFKLNIETASDPIEGLCKIYHSMKNDNKYFDVVFSDENMPFMKGSNFVKFYCEQLIYSGFYKIPFISISSDTFNSKRKEELYFQSILNKPCKKKEICKIITDVFLIKTKID